MGYLTYVIPRNFPNRHHSKPLLKKNYIPLLTSCKLDLQKIGKHYLSWEGRIAALKMIVLPKILYIFRALPIYVPPSFFKSIKGIFSSFVWAQKKNLDAHTTQHTIPPQTNKGMGFPDAKDYYAAVILDHMRHLF